MPTQDDFYLAEQLRGVDRGEHKATARGLLGTTWRQLRRHLPAVLAVAALSDVVMFLLHRLSHRLTNTGVGRRDPSCTAALMRIAHNRFQYVA